MQPVHDLTLDAGPEEEKVSDMTQAGQGMVEYAMILMTIALLLIITVAVLGHQTSNIYSNISHALP